MALYKDTPFEVVEDTVVVCISGTSTIGQPVFSTVSRLPLDSEGIDSILTDVYSIRQHMIDSIKEENSGMDAEEMEDMIDRTIPAPSDNGYIDRWSYKSKFIGDSLLVRVISRPDMVEFLNEGAWLTGTDPNIPRVLTMKADA